MTTENKEALVEHRSECMELVKEITLDLVLKVIRRQKLTTEEFCLILRTIRAGKNHNGFKVLYEEWVFQSISHSVLNEMKAYIAEYKADEVISEDHEV